jgi:DNA-binding response OmpR family regulator
MKKLLIIDDDEDLLNVLGGGLKRSGFEVRTLAKAEGTFRVVDEFKPDLIILDITLCEHDGRDICRKLKASAHTKHIKIIMYSAHHEMGDDFTHYGADDFIQKPFPSAKMIERINFHLT